MDTAPKLTTTDLVPVSGPNGADYIGPFVGGVNKMVEGQDAMESPRCVMLSQELHSLDGEITGEEGYIKNPSSNTEPSSGGLEKRRDDDQPLPHVSLVTTHTPLQPAQRSIQSKYNIRSPPSPAKEVTNEGGIMKKDETVLKKEMHEDSQRDTQDDGRKT